MADSNISFSSQITDFNKLKVSDLKKHLKVRGLPTTGNKNELIARLQGALKGLDVTDDLEEDLLNDVDDDEHLDTSESVIQELKSALEVSPPEKNLKRKMDENAGITIQTDGLDHHKKIILDRNPSVCSDSSPKQNEDNVENVAVKQADVPLEKKVVKLSELTVKERLEMRAKKFGVQLSNNAKKEARSERFGLNTTNISKTGNVDSGANLEILQKRAERFGGSVSTVISSLEKQKILDKRKERFGLTNGAISVEKVKHVKSF